MLCSLDEVVFPVVLAAHEPDSGSPAVPRAEVDRRQPRIDDRAEFRSIRER